MPQSTTDYDMFNFHESNRKINENHVKKLVNSLKVKNNLKYRPILVDSQRNVIDGQHRLMAAKELHLPIFYEMMDGSESDDMILLNAHQRIWKRDDYCLYYANQGNKNYQDLIAFCNKKNIKLTEGLIYFGINGGHQSDALRAGRFQFDPRLAQEYEEYILKVNYLTSFLEKKIMGKKDFIKSATFIRSLISLFSSDMFDFNTLISKIELNIDWMHRCNNISSYRHMFLKIYNFRNSKPINITMHE